MLGKFGDACHQLRHSIAVADSIDRGFPFLAIAEALDRGFPLSAKLDHTTRRSAFRPTLLRSMIVILGDAFLRIQISFHLTIDLSPERKQNHKLHFLWKISKVPPNES